MTSHELMPTVFRDRAPQEQIEIPERMRALKEQRTKIGEEEAFSLAAILVFAVLVGAVGVIVTTAVRSLAARRRAAEIAADRAAARRRDAARRGGQRRYAFREGPPELVETRSVGDLLRVRTPATVYHFTLTDASLLHPLEVGGHRDSTLHCVVPPGAAGSPAVGDGFVARREVSGEVTVYPVRVLDPGDDAGVQLELDPAQNAMRFLRHGRLEGSLVGSFGTVGSESDAAPDAEVVEVIEIGIESARIAGRPAGAPGDELVFRCGLPHALEAVTFHARVHAHELDEHDRDATRITFVDANDADLIEVARFLTAGHVATDERRVAGGSRRARAPDPLPTSG